jgi:hypothetical protein|uniref:Uncharacterized protein n=1 Tax=Oryza rufipogon TaxID=4529 RepID=A0A0E0P7V9_ORYRU
MRWPLGMPRRRRGCLSRSPDAAERELGDCREPRKDPLRGVAEHGTSIERESVAHGGVRLLPLRVGERRVAFGRGEQHEHPGQVLRVVALRRWRHESRDGWGHGEVQAIVEEDMKKKGRSRIGEKK